MGVILQMWSFAEGKEGQCRSSERRGTARRIGDEEKRKENREDLAAWISWTLRCSNDEDDNADGVSGIVRWLDQGQYD